MEISSMKKSKRIALISVAAAMLAVCSPVSAFAVVNAQPVTVTYNGQSSAVDLGGATELDAFQELMPNGPAKSQEIYIRNTSNAKAQVYFQAVPSNASTVDLLDQLDLTVTFKLTPDSTEKILYQGKASGKGGTGTPGDISTDKISLGYIDKRSASGVLTAMLSAPETMDNAFADAKASISWKFLFQSTSNGGGGGGGGGGGANAPGTAVVSSLPPVESIATESVPQGGPASSSPTGSPESIPNENVPLSVPPKTGETPVYLWIVLVAALASCVVFVAARGKTNSSGGNH